MKVTHIEYFFAENKYSITLSILACHSTLICRLLFYAYPYITYPFAAYIHNLLYIYIYILLYIFICIHNNSIIAAKNSLSALDTLH